MVSRYNNNVDDAHYSFVFGEPVKWSKYKPPLYIRSYTFAKPVRSKERIIYNVIPRN